MLRPNLIIDFTLETSVNINILGKLKFYKNYLSTGKAYWCFIGNK